MSDEVNTTKVSTRFARKGKVEKAGDYEMVEAEAIVEQVFDGDIDPEALTTVIEDQFILIKAQVLTQLGLSFEQAEDGLISETFPGAVTVESKAKPAKKRLAPVPDPEEDEEEEEEEEEAPPVKKKAAKAPAKPAPKKKTPPPVEDDDDEDEDEDDEDEIVPKDEKEELFLELMKFPKKWKLNNSNKPNAPRWQHTTKKRPGTDYAVGLWAKDAPRWFEDPFA